MATAKKVPHTGPMFTLDISFEEARALAITAACIGGPDSSNGDMLRIDCGNNDQAVCVRAILRGIGGVLQILDPSLRP